MGKHLLTIGAVALAACFIAGIFVSRHGFNLETEAATRPTESLDEALEAPTAPEESPQIPEAAQAPEGQDDALEQPPEPQGGIPGIPPQIDFSLKQAVVEAGRYVVNTEDGHRLILTLDPDVQQHLERIFARYQVPHAGFVAIEPATGRVLAMVSEESAEEPIKDVALKAMAPSASIFKIVTAAALIEGKGVDPKARVCVPEGPSKPSADDILGRGAPSTACMDLGTAFGHSNNYVFSRLANKHLSADELRQWSTRFGYNEPIPFNFPVDASRAVFSDDPIERALSASGFWHTYLGPLHGALIAATVANGGVMMRPNIIEEILDPEGEVAYAFKPVPYKKVVSEDTARKLAELMVYPTTVGTARAHLTGPKGLPEGYTPAGKTGTLSQRKPYLMFSWFVGFAPLDKPQVAVSALLCNPARWRIKATFAAAEALKIFARKHAVPPPLEDPPEDAVHEAPPLEGPPSAVVIPPDDSAPPIPDP